jgi:4'-phosphopantetheinyl transferase
MNKATGRLPSLNLGADEVHLWFAEPKEIRDEALLRAYEALLSDEELARMRQFRFAEHRHVHLVAHALMRVVLSRYAGVAPAEWRFVNNAYGRPEIAAPAGVPPLRFNLSHCADLVLFGVALDEDIGVDVENAARGAPPADFARRFFAEREYRDWMAVAPERREERFFEYWTLKEAYVKARGQGLHLPTTQFAFQFEPDGGIDISFERDLDDDPRDWSFWQFRPAAAQHAALALRGRRAARHRAVCWRGVPLLDERLFSCAAVHRG